jgi:predicted Fe-S protein YdhL (DUF1289 family)
MNESVNIGSPCINVCVIDAETGYCLGCYRTVEEVSTWTSLPIPERVKIVDQLEHRRRLSGDNSTR